MTNHITALPFSVFINPALVDPENRWVLDENALFDEIKADDDRWPYLDWPTWAVWSIDDPLPLFLAAPSPEFLQAIRRDIAPIIDTYARAG